MKALPLLGCFKCKSSASHCGTFISHTYSHIHKVVIFYCVSCFKSKIWCFLNPDLPTESTTLHMKKLRATTSPYVYFKGYLPSLLQICVLFECSYYHSQSLVLLCLSLLNILVHHLIQIYMKICRVRIIECIATSTWSMIFVSAEKRFRISPSGVMSKNLLDKLKPKSNL